MKKILLSLGLVFMFVLILAVPSFAEDGVLTNDLFGDRYDCGTITESERLDKTYTFRNTSAYPVYMDIAVGAKTTIDYQVVDRYGYSVSATIYDNKGERTKYFSLSRGDDGSDGSISNTTYYLEPNDFFTIKLEASIGTDTHDATLTSYLSFEGEEITKNIELDRKNIIANLPHNGVELREYYRFQNTESKARRIYLNTGISGDNINTNLVFGYQFYGSPRNSYISHGSASDYSMGNWKLVNNELIGVLYNPYNFASFLVEPGEIVYFHVVATIADKADPINGQFWFSFNSLEKAKEYHQGIDDSSAGSGEESGSTGSNGGSSNQGTNSGGGSSGNNSGVTPDNNPGSSVNTNNTQNTNDKSNRSSMTSINNAQVSGLTIKPYTGKPVIQDLRITDQNKELKNGVDYSVTYVNNVNAGTAYMIINGQGDYYGAVVKSFAINKSKNPIRIKAKKVKISRKRLLKKKVIIKPRKVLKISGAKGKVRYAKLSLSKKKFAKKFKVNAKNGKITICKGVKKGTYKLKIKVTSSGNMNYLKGSKKVEIKIVVA